MASNICALFFTFVGLICMVQCWPSGAPEKTCSTLLPRHGATQPKEAQDSPYTLEQTVSTYNPGDQVKVVLKSPKNVAFKGLLVQAIDPDTGKTIGTFVEGRGLKLLDSCSSVTHADNRNKRSAILVWNSPSTGSPGSVVFRGTVVQKYDNFYKGLISTVNANA